MEYSLPLLFTNHVNLVVDGAHMTNNWIGPLPLCQQLTIEVGNSTNTWSPG